MLIRFGLLCIVAILGACAPSTPETRIAQSPENFSRLSSEDQALIRQGKIQSGMSPEAVYYAWGRPAREMAGADENATTLRWDYAGSTPIYTTNVYGAYYGGGYGYFGRRYPRYGYAVAPQVTYVPYRRASVWFINNRVSKWERVQ
ncbi:hypothetical protein [Haloferula sp.]|uniref:hypothetical protein n=1 Tax=Haloferula sp. TaxID=2497595 RepID=UPI003C779872